MNLSKTVKKLCAPARFYLGISIFMILLILIQNLFHNNSNELCVGSYTSDISEFANISVFFLLKILYVVFWTWLLNVLCRNGFKSVSWFLVLLPFILFALGIALLVYSELEVESFDGKKKPIIKPQAKKTPVKKSPIMKPPVPVM